jgi:hypothetical protein
MPAAIAHNRRECRPRKQTTAAQLARLCRMCHGRWGFSLPVVYLIWIGVVLAVYPLCRRHVALKARRRDW